MINHANETKSDPLKSTVKKSFTHEHSESTKGKKSIESKKTDNHVKLKQNAEPKSRKNPISMYNQKVEDLQSNLNAIKKNSDEKLNVHAVAASEIGAHSKLEGIAGFDDEDKYPLFNHKIDYDYQFTHESDKNESETTKNVDALSKEKCVNHVLEKESSTTYELETENFECDLQWKINKIRNVLDEPVLDVYALQQLAEEDEGFVSDDLRKEVWPRLLLVHQSQPVPLLTCQQAQLHSSYSQVVMDVERTLKRFPPDISPEKRQELMDKLTRVIMTVLQRNPLFHYYQGYHDVGITFLLVCGEKLAILLLEELSLTHLREFLQPTMERTQRWLAYLYPMLAAQSPALYNHLEECGVGTMFCLPWLITWYAHSLSEYRHVVRLYDFLLASPPLMPIYVAGAIILHREQQLLAVPCDMPSMHQALSRIPDDMPLESVFKEARQMYKRLPPASLSDGVDRYLLRQKQREEAERAERDRRIAARKQASGRSPAWWLPSQLRRAMWATSAGYGRTWAFAAGTVALVAVALGVASIYFRPDSSRLIGASWGADRPVIAP